jgi:hypothetical protein
MRRRDRRDSREVRKSRESSPQREQGLRCPPCVHSCAVGFPRGASAARLLSDSSRACSRAFGASVFLVARGGEGSVAQCSARTIAPSDKILSDSQPSGMFAEVRAPTLNDVVNLSGLKRAWSWREFVTICFCALFASVHRETPVALPVESHPAEYQLCATD